jgi:signal transduction histidine kinase/CheY-like chemotaxis protein
MHRLLERQLRKARGPDGNLAIDVLLAAVSATYTEAEESRRRSDRANALMSTELGEMNAALERRRAEAEAANIAKSAFLANMSHEIRTPLNGVLGMAQALEADPLEPEERSKVAIILDSGQSLMALLNDVLDLSKIEAGKLEIAPIMEDLELTVRRVCQLFESQAQEKGLDLTLSAVGALPRYISFDPVRVRQCVSNLVSNAIKFTAKGQVSVLISAGEPGNGERGIEIKVSDSGIGMSKEGLSRLFSAFSQADSSTTRRFGGSGLGLSISRQLARLMGGDIVVESEPGKGSVFTMTFMAVEGAVAATVSGDAVPNSALSDAPNRTSLFGARVLLTDDHPINRQVIKLFLSPQGCAIEEASNGLEALEKLATQPFDVVLLDVQMPVMDGKETIRRIRSSSEAWRSLPVIALTADAMSGDREKFLALGMSDYLSKPVDQRELLAKLHHAISEKGGIGRTSSAA